MKQYTENDIQDYLDGTFTGNVNDIEKFFQQNFNAQKNLQAYKALYAGIENQMPPSPSIDLASSVIKIIENRKDKKERCTLDAYSYK